MGNGRTRYSRTDVEERTSDTLTAASPDQQSAASSGDLVTGIVGPTVSWAIRIGCLADG